MGWKNKKWGGKKKKKQSVSCDLLCARRSQCGGTVRMGQGCWCYPRSRVPLTGLWQGGGGQEVTPACCAGALTGSGERWVRAGAWNGPKPRGTSSPSVDFPRLCPAVAQESPKAVAVPPVLQPPGPPSNASEPHIRLHPKTWGGGVATWGCSGGPQPPQLPPWGVRQTHSKGDPRAKDADRARLFSLAAFCCRIHGNTITRDIYIIYILLKLHDQCTKTGVHC